MSASDKKKLRKEQALAAGTITKKQQQEQAEAKKLKLYTTIFITAIILVACIALVTLTIRFVDQSGVIQKNTIAANIGGTDMNSVELSYYYKDAINEMYNNVYSQYGSSYATIYFEALGLDLNKPLNKQNHPNGSGTWADYFINAALESAKSDFAMNQLAAKENYQLKEDTAKTLQAELDYIASYGAYAYGSANKYLATLYGHGAEMETYKAYLQKTKIADEFYTAHYDALTYDDAAIREHESKAFNNYSSYTYAYVYLSYTDFREGGTKDDKGNTTYTTEEDEAARAKLKEAADKLVKATSVEELKTMLADIKVGEKSSLSVLEEKNVLHTAINLTVSEWLSNKDRKAGDIAALENKTTDGLDEKDEPVVNGYYVTFFQERNDNTKLMSNVRHLLVKFEGGTKDDKGNVTYSDAEKGAAKTEAESILKKWQDGAKTEQSFIDLVKEYTDDTASKEDGGLYENIHHASNYVENFLNWSVDANRKAGDADVVETEYGYHVMYYVGDSKISYRDQLITDELKNAAQDAWYTAALKDITVTKKDLNKLPVDESLLG